MDIEYGGFIKSVLLKREQIPSFNTYPFNLHAIKNLQSIDLHPQCTFIIGENGSGKSTLLEAIATSWGFNPEGGSNNFHFSSRESHSELFKYLTLAKGIFRPGTGFFLRAESFYNVATEIDELDKDPLQSILHNYGGKSLHEQSHGESFYSLIQNRFFENGLYILDEPEAALSPSRQMGLITRIHDLCQQRCQFIIATHSPIIMAYPNAMIYLLENDKIKIIKYKDTEHYKITHRFLNNPDQMLKILLDDE